MTITAAILNDWELNGVLAGKSMGCLDWALVDRFLLEIFCTATSICHCPYTNSNLWYF